jgi:Fe-Mn family superoxide dismutase
MLKSTLPKLKYSYDGLEPVFSAKLLELHHSKHHQAYVNNLNIAMEELEEAISKNNVEKISELSQSIKFNGGGHFNHSFFWDNLAPVNEKGGDCPDSLLVKQMIDR